MKKNILIITFICTVSIYSQENKKVVLNKNELKLNIASTLGGFPEITFEKSLNNETSFGISLGFSLQSNSKDEENSNYNFSIIPYYRVYFDEKPNTGFFIEGNAAIYSQNPIEGDFFNNEKDGGIGFGLGFSLGKKYTTKGGWIGEFSFGLTRTFINSDKLNLYYHQLHEI